MKADLLKYKSVVHFVVVFLIVYIALTYGYKTYLDLSDGATFYPDYITHIVAKQSAYVIDAFGYQAEVFPHPDEPSMKLLVNSKFVARIVEGCNAVSVIILFVSFVVAFTGRFKETILYVVLGSVLIYVVNIIRIAIITIGLYRFPRKTDLLHDVIFPLIIYGMVFILWMFWVNRFSKKTTDG